MKPLNVRKPTGTDGVLVIINNGAYGKRMCEIAEAYQLDWIEFLSPPDQPINLDQLHSFTQSIPRKVSFLLSCIMKQQRG